jgi:hypothetical protein
MANTANTNSKAFRDAAKVIREEDLEDMEQFQRDLEAKIDQAYEDGRTYMMSQYVKILAGVKSEVKRVRDRFDRESLAAHRKAHRTLKEQTKQAKQDDDF